MSIRRIQCCPVIIVLVATFLLAGCVAGSKKARILERADRYFKAGDYDKAKIEYLNVLRLDNQNATAYQQIGLIWFEQGVPLQAAPYLSRAREIAPQNVSVRVKLGLALEAIGQSSEARKQAAAVLQQDPANSDAIVLLADASRTKPEIADVEQALQKFPDKNTASFHLAGASLAIKKGDLETAAGEVQQAVAADPKSVQAHLSRAYLYLLRADPGHAEAELKTAAELSPPRSEARVKYAEFKSIHGSAGEAKTLLQEITKTVPDFLPAWRDLAQIALTEKRYDDGIALLENIFSRDPENPEARILQAQLLMAKGEPSKAIVFLEKVNSTYPNNPVVEYQLGRAYIANKNLVQATAAMQQAVTLRPDYPEAIFVLAGLNLRLGKMQPAVLALEDLLRKHPDIPEAQTLLVQSYRALGRLDDAAAFCRQLIKNYPQYSNNYYILGSILRQQQKNQEAREAFEKAIELAPDNLNPVDELVIMDLLEKRYDSAGQRVEAQLKKNPQSAGAHLLAAKISLARGGPEDAARAESELKKTIELDPNLTVAYDLLVSAYLQRNQSAEALKQLAAEQEQNPDNPRPLLMTAVIYEQMKGYQKARDAYEKALTIAPNSVLGLNNLAYLYAEHLDQLDKAYELAQKARSLQPDNGMISDTLGWILFKRREYPQALELIEDSASKFPNNPEVQFHLGMTNYMMGHADAAKAALERATAATVDFPGKDEARQRLLQLQSGSKNETANGQATSTDQSNDPLAQIRKAEEYEQKGDFANAASAYEQVLKINPKLVRAMVKLAQLYAGPLKQPAKALELARTARELAAGDAQTLGTIGRIALQAGNASLAYALLQDSVHRGVNDPGVLHDLAMTSYFFGKISEARATMEKVKNSDSNLAESAKRFLALTAIDQQPAEPTATVPSEAEIDQILKSQPDYLPALTAKAAIEVKRGDVKAASEIYLHTLQKYPDFTPAQKGLALIYSSDPANLGKAYDLAMKARKSLPDDPEVARTLAELSFKRNEFSYAIQLFQEAGSKHPLAANDLYYLGMAQIQSRHEAEGRKTLEQALSAGLSDPLAQEAKKRLAADGQPK